MIYHTGDRWKLTHEIHVVSIRASTIEYRPTDRTKRKLSFACKKSLPSFSKNFFFYKFSCAIRQQSKILLKNSNEKEKRERNYDDRQRSFGCQNVSRTFSYASLNENVCDFTRKMYRLYVYIKQFREVEVEKKSKIESRYESTRKFRPFHNVNGISDHRVVDVDGSNSKQQLQHRNVSSRQSQSDFMKIIQQMNFLWMETC